MFTHSEHDRLSLDGLTRSIETTLQRYGYQSVETDLIQPAQLFLTRAGDQIADHLFTFDMKGEPFSLRPEFTSAAVVEYLHSHPEGAAARWMFSGYVFEEGGDERPYQRYSVGAELLGVDGIHAEAELISAAASALQATGQTGFSVTIGTVAITRATLAQFDLDPAMQRLLLSLLHGEHNWQPDYLEAWVESVVQTGSLRVASANTAADNAQVVQAVMQQTASDSLIGQRTRDEIIQRLLLKQARAGQRHQIVAAIDFLKQWSSVEVRYLEADARLKLLLDPDLHHMIDEFLHMIELAVQYGVAPESIYIRPALSRGWDYYSSTVFEYHTQDGKVAVGGGRYDEFATLLGAVQPVPAVGMAFYLDALDVTRTVQSSPSDRLELMFDAGNEPYAIAWARRLRALGLTVVMSARTDDSPNESIYPGESLTVGSTTVYLQDQDLSALAAALRGANA